MKSITEKKWYKKPKYKIGDIIIYKDRYEKGMVTYYQSAIVKSYGLHEENDPKDVLSWFYQTEQTIEDDFDSLDETDIIEKI